MSEADLGSKSVPRNPLLFSILYRIRFVERIGSGIRRIFDACAEHGVAAPELQVSDDWFTVDFQRPEHATQQVTQQVDQLLAALEDTMSRSELMELMDLMDRNHFTTAYLRPALEAGLIEMTLPDRPNSRLQRYRLTQLGLGAREVRRTTK